MLTIEEILEQKLSTSSVSGPEIILDESEYEYDEEEEKFIESSIEENAVQDKEEEQRRGRGRKYRT